MPEASWRIALASAIGTSHIAGDLPCQDSVAHEVVDSVDGAVLIAIVCDGAGSAAYSELGASLAADFFLRSVTSYFTAGGRLEDIDRKRACAWIDETASVLEVTANEASHAVRDYACTLLAAIVGEKAAAFVQIGDGAIVVADAADDGWSWVFWPQHGEFANTTNFIISANAADLMEFDVSAGRVDEIAIFSDGIENLVLHNASRTVHAAFFNAMFPPVRRGQFGLDTALSTSLEKYLSSPLVCEKTDDDKSLILASRRNEKICEEANGEGRP